MAASRRSTRSLVKITSLVGELAPITVMDQPPLVARRCADDQMAAARTSPTSHRTIPTSNLCPARFKAGVINALADELPRMIDRTPDTHLPAGRIIEPGD